MRHRRGEAVAVGLAVAVAVAMSGRAEAAELAVVGADECADAADTIADQVADLLGRPLASVTGVDFEVKLARAPAGAWQLRLDTIDRTDADHERRSRELTANSCGEVADAAAVAIAMTVRSRAAAQSPPPSTTTAAAPPVVTPPPAAPPVVTRSPEPPPAVPTTMAGGVALVGDAGALPDPGVGVELRASLRHRRVRLALAGTVFASQVAYATGSTGGEFRLWFGSADACLPVALGRKTLLGCAGFELGRLSSQGVGVVIPRLGSTRWEAARAEAGLSIPLSPRAAVVARAGVAVPLSRTQFVIDGGTPVHRAAAVAVRLALGTELEF